METISEQLIELNDLKEQLAINLNSMGVESSTDEPLKTLVPKVLECKTEQNVEWVDNPSGGLASLNSIVKKVDVPYGISSIATGAFTNCTSLESITIPDSVTSIGERAFYGCTSLTSANIPNGVPRIENSTFWQCTSLTSINIPDSVTSIGERAFINCKSLESITIPDSMTSIVEESFNYCESLASITIPDSVTSIGVRALSNCRKLKDIYYTGTEEQWNTIRKGTEWNYHMGSNVSGGTVIHYNYTG